MIFSQSLATCLRLAIVVLSLFGSMSGVAALRKRVPLYSDVARNVRSISRRAPPSSDPTCPDPYQHSDVFKSVAYFANW